ncbi:ferredoxin [Paenibacillus sp. MY03]|jgi:2Fe-2S ferredoxin|uniref:2Fe-2S iron-sulfur cluster-binding protein n=1 Tax=unclassified Paenibacillus TaxID=185978 RepID=UPI000B3D2417|nr:MULTISPECIES: 2Fe-2S iron-sulfur cluster-binding protein [unclassified Paenibacillus]OUS77381.1 ferredoxin [Paenibacillus sp. MY03]QNK55376.1 2Fe-2S iron-sulfur cluster binding domain-containing protein [Paenibacillus sp. PAMC21692]
MDAEVVFWPSGKSVRVRRGTSVLDASKRAGIAIATRCGGKAACFMCKVTVRPGSELQPIGDVERRKLAGLDEKGIRLSCQTRVTGRVEVDLPLDPLKAAVARQLARQKELEDELW